MSSWERGDTQRKKAGVEMTTSSRKRDREVLLLLLLLMGVGASRLLPV